MNQSATKTMRAVVLTAHGDLDKLHYREDYPRPHINDDEVLIRVGACGINNTDINTRTAWYSKGSGGATTGAALPGANAEDAAWGGAPIQFPRIQGADICGTVQEIGNNVNPALLGKRVLIDTWLRDWQSPHDESKTGYVGSECDGGFAEYVKIGAQQVHPIETTLSDAELATFATAYSTAEQMLNRVQLCANDTLLINGASGGVGGALLQLAKRRQATVIAMCGEDKHAAVSAIGADAVLPRAPHNLAAALTAVCGNDTVSVIADVVGGDDWRQLINALARRGRYVCSGAIAGAEVALDLRDLYLRDLSFFGSTVLPPGVFADVVGYIQRGEIRPLLAKTYPLQQLREAQQTFIAKRHVGNIVITL